MVYYSASDWAHAAETEVIAAAVSADAAAVKDAAAVNAEKNAADAAVAAANADAEDLKDPERAKAEKIKYKSPQLLRAFTYL